MTSSLVQMWPNLAECLSFTVMMIMIFVSGLGFQTPLVIIFLARIGVVPTASLARKRRIVILVILILMAVMTRTGDAFSLLMLSLPMYGLLELGLLLGRRIERKRVIG